MQTEQAVQSLNTLLRGEISATETYRQAITKLKDAQTRTQLVECERSHKERVTKLTTKIRALGGEPATSSGPWGAFTKLVQGGADVFGDKAAVSVLEQGEDHGVTEYRTEMAKLDLETRSLVERELLPAAEKTHGAMSTLKRTVH